MAEAGDITISDEPPDTPAPPATVEAPENKAGATIEPVGSAGGVYIYECSVGDFVARAEKNLPEYQAVAQERVAQHIADEHQGAKRGARAKN